MDATVYGTWVKTPQVMPFITLHPNHEAYVAINGLDISTEEYIQDHLYGHAEMGGEVCGIYNVRALCKLVDNDVFVHVDGVNLVKNNNGTKTECTDIYRQCEGSNNPVMAKIAKQQKDSEELEGLYGKIQQMIGKPVSNMELASKNPVWELVPHRIAKGLEVDPTLGVFLQYRQERDAGVEQFSPGRVAKGLAEGVTLERFQAVLGELKQKYDAFINQPAPLHQMSTWCENKLNLDRFRTTTDKRVLTHRKYRA